MTLIIVSLHDGAAHVERSRAAGAFAYNTKKKIYRELLPAIDHALWQPRSGGNIEPRTTFFVVPSP